MSRALLPRVGAAGQLCALRGTAATWTEYVVAGSRREDAVGVAQSRAFTDSVGSSGCDVLLAGRPLDHWRMPRPASTVTARPLVRGFAAEAGSNVTVVETDQQFRQILDAHKGGPKKLIVDFYAVWCGPCRQISPYFEQLSGSYPGLTFLKVDVDKLNQVAAEASISAVPAFQVWEDGTVVDEFVGASKGDLKALCEKHS